MFGVDKKILHLNFSDSGGAAVAVKRINDSLRFHNINSSILVAEKKSNNKTIIFKQTLFDKFIWEQKKKISRNLKYIFRTDNKNTHSIALFGSNLLSQIELFKPDILNIHWIGNELISLNQINKIKIPIIWTLHDMWLYCGAEHYSYNTRYIDGYLNNNRPKEEKKFDLNRWVWERKKKYLSKKFSVIATSEWQLKNSRASSLLKNKDIHKIPLPIDTNFWKPIEKNKAREILGWDKNKTYFLFGFSDFGKKYIKGLDLALNIFNDFNKKYPKKKSHLNIFGQISKNEFNQKNLTLIGMINDLHHLKLLYSASDLLLATSRLESFGQIALEALACGLPIVVLKNTGTLDLILDENMGFIFNENIHEDLNQFYMWFLKLSSINLQEKLHKNIKTKYSYNVIGERYKNLLNNL